ncbi:MAG: ribosome small subunit-dependent GTPase A [Candidatus Hydrogenedentes bacterium]|nr:ribosome small subunit-dependent GTPase A [Candidatus Hydrogenedentota bacterium]
MSKPFKRNKPVRKRNWDANDWDTASRQGRSKRPDSAPESVRPADDYFSDGRTNGVVVSPYGVLAFALCDGSECLCRVDESLVDGKSSVLASGDRVFIEVDDRGPVVRAVRPRANKLSRPAIGSDREQVFAANINHAVIVASVARPAFNPGLIDRYLVAAQAGGVEPIVCVNKVDLAGPLPDGVGMYRELALKVVLTSCETGEGIDELRSILQAGTSVLVGHSGVGKSSLINALDPNVTVHTQEISDSTNKGRHTTSASRLYELTGGIRIIDTPGIKQLGLWGVSPAELNYYFDEIAETSGLCKFRDCTHTHEPRCAVRDAVESGRIARARYESYLRIRASLEEGERSNPQSP